MAAAPAAVAVTVLVGMLIAAISLRATSLYFGIITLAFNLVLVELARQLDITGGSQGLFGVPRPELPGGAPMSDLQMFYLVIVCLGLVLIFHRNLVRSASGRAIRAARESADSAASLGIPPFATKLTAFGYSAFVVGVGGALFALLNGFVVWTLGELRASIDLLLGLFLGGIGTINGPLVGSTAIAGARRLLADQAEIQALMLGMLMLVSILVVPGGIVGYFRRRRPVVPGPMRPASDDAGVLAFLEVAQAAGPALAAHGVSKRFGGVQALQAVDVTIDRGTLHGLIGPNGSGKSTFCDVITRIQRPDDGTVELFGASLPRRTTDTARRGLVRVFQMPHLFEDETVLDNVMAGMHLHRHQTGLGGLFRTSAFRRDEIALRRRARDLLDFAGLGGTSEVQTALLSHGQKRLVEVVRALGAQPRLLILDEPATGLTSKEVESLSLLLRRLGGLGVTVLLIEHNLSLVMNVCDRITVFDGGARIADGTPVEVAKSEAVRAAYLATEDLTRELIVNG